MKKKFLALFSIVTAIFTIGSCGLSNTNSESSSQMESSIQSESLSSESSSSESSSSENSSSSSSSVTPPVEEGTHVYNDFTKEEKDLFIEYLGETIPFLPNDEYYVEEYYDEEYDESGINFYAFDVTQAEFNEYRKQFSGYALVDTEEDTEGDTWYYYEKGDINVDFAHYYYDGSYILDLYAYRIPDFDGGDTPVIPDDGEKTMLTNNGKGLPTSGNGVYDVDFTKATYAKNVTELYDYEEGCPTVSTAQSNPAVLVIPVEFSDMTATRNNYSIAKLEKVFNGGIGDTDYYSVHDYFYQSSYGQLDLDITVWDEWIRPTYKSSYYAKQKDNTGDLIGDQMVLNEALAKLEGQLDLSKFDSDNNGVIDAVVLVTTVQINYNNDFNWAFRYYNTYTNEQGSPYIYDKVFAKDYLWIPYSFLYESFNSQGNLYYTDTSVMNPYTFIHEFSHALGADDYYDTAGKTDPLNCYDVMDSMVGDHNPYTKFNYGWLTSSRLVVADSQITLTLEDFSKNGDTIIIANNWDEKLGVYQEYFLLMYYTNNGLNGGEYGYFNEEGILVYHVNASLYEEIRDGKPHYTIYNNNTAPSAGGTKDNLIEFISRTNNDYVYGVGESLSKDTKDDSGKKVAYTFTVNSLSGGVASLTFTKNA